MRSETQPITKSPTRPRYTATPGSSGRRRPRRLSAGALLPVVLAVLAAVFAYEALQDRASMAEVVVARSSIPAGGAVTHFDTRIVEVHASDLSAARDLASPSQMNGGWVAAVGLQPGEPVTLDELSRISGSSGGEQMSIPVPEDQAVGGGLAAGDIVDVIEATQAGLTRYVARDLRVVSVAPSGSAGGVLGGSSGNFFVVVEVDKQTALELAAALAGSNTGAGASIDIIRSAVTAGAP